MVVLVLITSCQVLLKPNIGPVAAQTTTLDAARINASGCPVAREAHLAKTVKAW
jgi:hypothetical protein